jgi:hypothetical protein
MSVAVTQNTPSSNSGSCRPQSIKINSAGSYLYTSIIPITDSELRVELEIEVYPSLLYCRLYQSNFILFN